MSGDYFSNGNQNPDYLQCRKRFYPHCYHNQYKTTQKNRIHTTNIHLPKKQKNSSIETTDKNNTTIRDLPPKNIYDSRETVFFRDKKNIAAIFPNQNKFPYTPHVTGLGAIIRYLKPITTSDKRKH